MRALWPRLVPASQLDTAYTLDSTAQELIWIAGPLLLAALLAVGQPRLPLLACAALSVGGTAAYVTSPRIPRGRPGAARDGAEAFTWTFAVITIGQSAGSAAGGVIVQGTGTGAAFLAASAASVAGAALGLACIRYRQDTLGFAPA